MLLLALLASAKERIKKFTSSAPGLPETGDSYLLRRPPQGIYFIRERRAVSGLDKRRARISLSLSINSPSPHI